MHETYQIKVITSQNAWALQQVGGADTDAGHLLGTTNSRENRAEGQEEKNRNAFFSV